MTDKEKFIKLFDEIGVEYKVYCHLYDCSISICDSSLSTSIIEARKVREGGRLRWGEDVWVHFDAQGKFICFEGWGE